MSSDNGHRRHRSQSEHRIITAATAVLTVAVVGGFLYVLGLGLWWLPRRKPTKNRAGLLRKSIEFDWPEPDEERPRPAPGDDRLSREEQERIARKISPEKFRDRAS